MRLYICEDEKRLHLNTVFSPILKNFWSKKNEYRNLLLWLGWIRESLYGNINQEVLIVALNLINILTEIDVCGDDQQDLFVYDYVESFPITYSSFDGLL